MSALNTNNIGRIEWGLVVMGCVLDVVRGVLTSIKRGHPDMSIFSVFFTSLTHMSLGGRGMGKGKVPN